MLMIRDSQVNDGATLARHRLARPLGALTAIFVMMACAHPVPLDSQATRWTAVDSVEDVVWNGVSVSGADRIVVVGRQRKVNMIIRQSTDGGATWRNILFDTLRTTPDGNVIPAKALSVAFGAVHEVYVATDTGSVLLSRDSGKSWSTLDVGTDGSDLARIVMASPAHGALIAGTNEVALTDDGWRSFRRVELELPEYQFLIDLAMPSPSVIYASHGGGGHGGLMRSRTHGATWESLALPDARMMLGFVSELVGWAAGRRSTGVGQRAIDLLSKTTDGGESWSTQIEREIEPAFGLTRVAAATIDDVFAVGYIGKALYSSDGGATWSVEATELDPNELPSLKDVDVTGMEKAVAVSSSGVILIREPVSSAARAEPSADRSPFQLQLAGRRLIIRVGHRDTGRLFITDVRGEVIGVLSTHEPGETVSFNLDLFDGSVFFLSNGRTTVPVLLR